MSTALDTLLSDDGQPVPVHGLPGYLCADHGAKCLALAERARALGSLSEPQLWQLVQRAILWYMAAYAQGWRVPGAPVPADLLTAWSCHAST